MSMMGELTFFLGIQVKQIEEGTFVILVCIWLTMLVIMLG
jgi:hypothetical protein